MPKQTDSLAFLGSGFTLSCEEQPEAEGGAPLLARVCISWDEGQANDALQDLSGILSRFLFLPALLTM